MTALCPPATTRSQNLGGTHIRLSKCRSLGTRMTWQTRPLSLRFRWDVTLVSLGRADFAMAPVHIRISSAV